LDSIKGIGPETAKMLLRELKSVKKVKESNLDMLSQIIGSAKGQLVYKHFHQTN